MTGIEKLRAYAEAYSTIKCAENLPRITGKCCEENNGCNACLKSTLDAIADQIERETLPRPRFEDGELVQVGDKYVNKYGNIATADTVVVSNHGFTLYDKGSATHFKLTESVKRPERPDTWEKLTADIERCGDSCAYFGRNCDDGGSACKGCPCHGADDACMVLVMRDVLGRAKKLAGVE